MPVSRRTFAQGLGALVLVPTDGWAKRAPAMEVRALLERDEDHRMVLVSLEARALTSRAQLVLVRNVGRDLVLFDATLEWPGGERRWSASEVRRVDDLGGRQPRVLPFRWVRVEPGEIWTRLTTHNGEVPDAAIDGPLAFEGKAGLFVKHRGMVTLPFEPIEVGERVG